MKRKTICFLAALLAVICVICGVGLWKINMAWNFKGSDEDTMESDADWFSAYNGEKIQRVISGDGDVYSPARCNDIIYYKADEAESLNTIIAEMKKEILEPLMSDMQTRPFTVTAYNVDEQNQIFHLPLLQDSLEEPDVPQWIQDYEWEETVQEAWLLPALEGYYRFEGVDLVSMDVLLSEGVSKEGMVPFAAQGSEEEFQFILVRHEDVYRLQRAVKLKDLLFPY